jgi:hypothetical protein
MAKPFFLTGVLKDDHTVTLDEALPLKPGRVLLTLQPLRRESRTTYREILAEIRQRQTARGHQARSREEVDSFLQAERTRGLLPDGENPEF